MNKFSDYLIADEREEENSHYENKRKMIDEAFYNKRDAEFTQEKNQTI